MKNNTHDQGKANAINSYKNLGMARFSNRLLLAVICLFILTSCGEADDPTSAVNIMGTWYGTVTNTSDNGVEILSITITEQTLENYVFGRWSDSTGKSGTLENSYVMGNSASLSLVTSNEVRCCGLCPLESFYKLYIHGSINNTTMTDNGALYDVACIPTSSVVVELSKTR